MKPNSFHVLRRHLFREVTIAWLVAGLLLQSATAVAPEWWTVRGVLLPNATADDYAVANVGQLKNVAKKAAQEMDAVLPGGAGPEIDALLASWAAAPMAGITRDDHAAINLGQLKRVAKPFYERLGLAYPWGMSTASPADFALANMGQLKRVFALPLPASLRQGVQEQLADLEARVAAYQALLLTGQAALEVLLAQHQEILSRHAALETALGALAAAGVPAGEVAAWQAAAAQAQATAGGAPALAPPVGGLLVTRVCSLSSWQWSYSNDPDNSGTISGWRGLYALGNRRGITHYLTAWESHGEDEPDRRDTLARLLKEGGSHGTTTYPAFEAEEKWVEHRSYDAPSFWPSVATGVDAEGWLRGGASTELSLGAAYVDDYGDYTPPDPNLDDEETPAAEQVAVPEITWLEAGLRAPGVMQTYARDVTRTYLVVRRVRPVLTDSTVTTVLGTATLRLAAGHPKGTATFTPAAGQEEGHGVSVRTVGGMQVLALEPPRQEEKSVEISLLSVEIVNASKTPVSELKVGKFDDGSAHALDYYDNLDIEKDPDRFFIRVGGNLGNGQTVKVKLETVENPDSSYNDNATWVELTESGGTESKSQLLVSGDVDDDHTSSGYNLGADDPSGESNTDRTHKVQLGGKVKISAIKIGTGNEIATDIKIPVPVKKTVHVKAVIMSDAVGVNVAEDIKQANERLAQVGVKVVLDSTVTKNVPFVVPDTDLVIENTTQVRATDIIDGQPQIGIKASAMIESFGTKNSIEDIHVFYVHGVLSGNGTGALGVSIREQDNSQGFANNFFVQDLHATFKTFAHELVHVLTNEGHWGTDYGSNVTPTRTEHNLMRIVNHNWMNTDKVREAKRLYPEQQTLIWGHRAVK